MNQVIDVWFGKIAAHAANDAAYYSLLSADEQQFVSGLKVAQYKSRVLEVRAKVRMKLADYVLQSPAALNIQRNEHGKPYLDAEHALAFNVSHSGDYWVLAICQQAANNTLGIDIELIKPRKDLSGLAEHCLTATEIRNWQSLPEAEKNRAFYHYWTGKEAFMKAVGRGLAVGLQNIELNSHQQLVSIPSEYGEANEWSLQHVSLDSDLCSTLCSHGSEKAIHIYPW